LVRDPIFSFTLARAQMANQDLKGAEQTLRKILDDEGGILLDSYAAIIPAAARDLAICTKN
jgi:hypothetical protein